MKYGISCLWGFLYDLVWLVVCVWIVLCLLPILPILAVALVLTAMESSFNATYIKETSLRETADPGWKHPKSRWWWPPKVAG